MWTREQIKTNAKAVMAKNYWMMVGVSAVYSILAGIFSSASSGASSYLENGMDYMPVEVVLIVSVIVIGISIVGIIFNIFVGNPLEVGKDRFYMCSRLQQTPFGELFCAFRSGQGYYMNIVKTQFLRRLYTALWSLLFIIPGIIKSYEYYMVPYILAETPNISSARAFEQDDDQRGEAEHLCAGAVLFGMAAAGNPGLLHRELLCHAVPGSLVRGAV